METGQESCWIFFIIARVVGHRDIVRGTYVEHAVAVHTGAVWDQLTDNDVLLETAQVIDLPLDGSLGQNFGGLLEGGCRDEGICRELVNRIQALRKESGLLVTDKINLKIKKDIILEKAIFENQNYILTETLAENLIVLDNFDDGVELKFDNIDSKLYLTKID